MIFIFCFFGLHRIKFKSYHSFSRRRRRTEIWKKGSGWSLKPGWRWRGVGGPRRPRSLMTMLSYCRIQYFQQVDYFQHHIIKFYIFNTINLLFSKQFVLHLHRIKTQMKFFETALVMELIKYHNIPTNTKCDWQTWHRKSYNVFLF